MSHSELTRVLFLLSGIALVGVGALFGLFRLGYARLRKRPLTARFGVQLWLLVTAGVLELIGFFYARQIEPQWLETTQQQVTTDALPKGTRLRIVHLTDLHMGGNEEWATSLIQRVNEFSPDLLIFTGDTLSSHAGVAPFREVMGQIHAPQGKFVARGNHDLERWIPPKLYEGVATELTGSPVALLDGQLHLCGAPYGSPELLSSCLQQTPEAGRIVAFHTPDAIEDLQPLHPFLYLAGHTHGGQIRLPFFGALVTFSKFDKKYEMGRYQVGATTLYVNRGIGGLPLRFLCRPEIAIIDLIGTGQ